MSKNDQTEPEEIQEFPEQADFDVDDDTKEVINIVDHPVQFRMDGTRIVMKPLEIRRIPKAYASPRQLQPNAPALPSTVEHLTGNKVFPIDHEKARGAARRAGRL